MHVERGYKLQKGKSDRLTIIDEPGIDPGRLDDAKRIIETYSNYRIDVGKRINPGGSMRAASLDEESIRAVQVARQTIDADRRSRMVEIPSGQADMRLWANKGDESKIRALLKKIESIVKRPQQITRTATTGPKGNFRKPSVAKTDARIVKAILDGASKENTRFAMNGVLVDGENLVVTNGHMLWIAKGEWGKDGFYPRYAIAKNGTLPAEPSTDADLPPLLSWRDLVPTYGANDAIPNVDVLTTMKHIQMAAKMAEVGGDGDYKGVLVVVNDDGTLGFAAYSPEFGTAEINIRDNYEVLGAVDPQYLSKSLAFHYIAGDTEVGIAFPYRNKPILIKGDARRATTVIMPFKLDEKNVEQQAITARPRKKTGADRGRR